MFDSSKMTLFFANKEFHLRFSLETSQPAANPEAYDLAKHLNNILEQLSANLLMSQKDQQNSTNLHKTPAPAYSLRDHIRLNTKSIKT